MNRLASETSPYLLQHANNPVDWYPWGEEALARARDEDRPILLSIGYAACHWCHVMEHESFEDEETARLQNEHFVNVKVDREERPGPRRGLHGRGRDADRARRLAADGVPHARRRAVLRRHVLPARAASRAAELSSGARGGLERVSRAARGRRPLGVAARRGDRPRRTPRAVVGAAHRVARQRGRARPPRVVRPGVGRLRASAEVPAALGARAAAAARRDGAGRADARRDGSRRYVRPRRGRFPPLLRRRPLARAALREDALRQRAPRPGLPPRVARHRPRALPRGGRGDGGVHAPRPAAAGRRVRVVAGRRHRRRRGADAHVDGGRGRTRGAAPAVRARALDRSRRARSRPFARSCSRSAPRGRSPGSTTRRSPRGTA